MLHYELLRDQGIVILTPEGALQKADFERVAQAVDPLIAEKGKLAGLMVHARAFPGWADFAALVTHLKFIKDHHREVKRVAIVTDATVLKHLPALANHLVAAEIRPFGFDEKEQALAWLESRP
jgi:hypothetical protein